VTQSSASVESISVELWFVAAGDAGTAEYSLDDLILAIQAGRVSASSLVWRQGMSDWLELDQVPLLWMMCKASFDKLQAVAPPSVETSLEGSVESAAIVEALAVTPPIVETSLEGSVESAAIVEALAVTPPIVETPLLGSANSAVIVEAIEEVECTVIQTKPDLSDELDWTIEPKETPTTTPARSLALISDLAKRTGVPLGPAALSTPGTLLARPTLTRPASAKREIARSLPQRESTPAAIQTAPPALSIALPVRPIEIDSGSKPAPVDPATVPPREMGTISRPAEKALSKSLKESRAPQTTPAVSGIVVGSTTAAVRPVVTRQSAAAPVRARAPLPAVTRRPTTVPVVQAAGHTSSPTKDARYTPAVAPALIPAKLQDSETLGPIFAPPTPLVELLPAVATRAIPYAALGHAEPIEAAGSLFPAVRSLPPETVEWRKSRTPLYVGVAAVAAVAAVVVMSLVSTPHKSRQITGTAAALTPSVSSLNIAAKGQDSLTPVQAATDLPLATATDLVAAPIAQTTQTPSKRAANSSNAGYPSVDATRPSKKLSRNEELAVANRQIPELKGPGADVADPPKLGPSNPAKPVGNSSSVETWDQGTVERRPWMNPGF